MEKVFARELSETPPPARIVEDRTPKKKRPFLFSKESRARIRNARSVFSFGVAAESARRSGGTVHLFNFRSKKVCANARITPPYETCSELNKASILEALKTFITP